MKCIIALSVLDGICEVRLVSPPSVIVISRFSVKVFMGQDDASGGGGTTDVGDTVDHSITYETLVLGSRAIGGGLKAEAEATRPPRRAALHSIMF